MKKYDLQNFLELDTIIKIKNIYVFTGLCNKIQGNDEKYFNYLFIYFLYGRM